METVASKVPKTLAQEMDRLIASGRYANRSEILRVAVRAFLDSGGSESLRRGPPPPNPAILAFRRRLAELAKDPRYRGRWVALHRGEPLDVDEDMDALVRRILDRREDPIHIGFATARPEPLRARLPGVRVRRRR